MFIKDKALLFQKDERPCQHPVRPMKRRTFLERSSLAAAGLALSGPFGAATSSPQTISPIRIDPTPLFELSPYLYMQFMEPLGVTDGSVEAAWDHLRDDWRDDVVEVTRALAPTMLRWGGIFADFYRWREGVGPRDKRPSMINLLWGGIESNQVGTAEFVDFCRRVRAEPLVCVNFESDGRQQYMKVKGSVRTGDAKEAAAWVSYCNDPSNDERKAHGYAAPHGIRHWQIGNETSYDKNGFDLDSGLASPAGRTACEPGRQRRLGLRRRVGLSGRRGDLGLEVVVFWQPFELIHEHQRVL